MRYDPERQHRRSIRLKQHDYTQVGVYFVTLCAHNREYWFGHMDGQEMHRSECGGITADCWQQIPRHFPHVVLDAFVVMPNHLHGIVVIDARATHDRATHDRATHASPLQSVRPAGPGGGSLGAIIGSFKSAVTRQVNVARGEPGPPIWQRNYYEHVVRNKKTLNAIREYILLNPSRWAQDVENPANL